MAIVTEVPGLQIGVSVDRTHQPVPQYIDEDDEQPPRSKIVYIESQPGSNFRVHYRLDETFPWKQEDIHIHIEIDGRPVNGMIVSAGSKPPYSHGSRGSVRTRENGRYICQKFAFAELTPSDDGTADENLVLDVNRLGTITVRCIRCIKGPQRYSMEDTRAPTFNHSVSEKKLKGIALSHDATLGEARTSAPFYTRRPIYPLGPAPFATYSFKYRSRQSLQSLRLIPDSPTPSSDPDDNQGANRPVEELTREELERFYQTHVMVKPEVKRERPDDDDEYYNSDDDSDGIEVTHTSQRPTKIYRTTFNTTTGVETIDLSNDD